MTKLDRLREIIGRYSSAVIAFSGGVDSTLLARIAGEVLADRVLLVTAHSSTYPERERDEARALAEKLGLKHEVIVSEETDIPEFNDNPPDRCYFCKRELFSRITSLAARREFDAVFDGSNHDDVACDYRPGTKALEELNVISPLKEAGLGKDEIREISRNLGLPTADKPAYACLASRFPYGEKITIDKLNRVGRAEEALRALGFTQLRVRSHGNCARVEFIASEIERAWQEREKIVAACANAGFTFVAIDAKGYRMGAMNEALDDVS
ncbi:MAG: ATP-dependent sacrificial sulfur transferase LarE [Chitinivibrionales bacterium]|nr:ATP-dependent sacrificial sulfur transferase LarE [Chitinivibrionales bacterium]MBD3397180.1 ATP-dependent sacrificial sulfur transferase LarE [Chitinivibrionales bacterium]